MLVLGLFILFNANLFLHISNGENIQNSTNENPPILNPLCEKGKVEEIGGLNCYITGSPHSNIAVILLSDIFGYEIPLTREIADKIGANGYYTVLPDFFHGDPFVSGRPNRLYIDWIRDHSPEKGIEEAKPLIEALKSKGFTKIGAAGFCWGGKVAVDLSKIPYIQVAILLHPSNLIVEDIKDVKVPISILGAENDTMCPPTLVKQFETALKAKPEVDSFVKVFGGVSHGWTIRYNATDIFAVKKANEAHRYMLHWLDNYLLI